MAAIVIPIFQGQRGHPVIFSSYYQREILEHQQPNGCQTILQRSSRQVLALEMGSDRLLRDLDTEKDYENI